ncbi:MAG TPA: hypothetical protein VKZ44_04250 [Taishania sp.]|nr:hypothetical protein [Taishania sp.]
MKLSSFLGLLLFSGYLLSQAPQNFTYQSVIRDAANSLVVNNSVGTKISILQGTTNGNVVYSETHTASTNSNGLLSLVIGAGTVQSGSFSSVDWSNGPYYLKIETDINGGTNYTLTGTQQLVSVPYALYAETAGTALNGSVGPQGPQGPVGDTGPAGTTGQAANTVFSTSQLVLTASVTNYTLIPGLTQTITVPSGAKVYVSTNGGFQNSATGTSYASGDFAIFVDGIASAIQSRVVAANTQGLGQIITHWNMSGVLSLTPGSHTIQVRAKDAGGTADGNVAGTNDLIKGNLSVLIIKE